MSIEINQTNQTPQNDNMVQPQSSGSGKWIMGGCGCLLLLMVVCGGGMFAGYIYFVKPAADFIFESQELATSNELVKEKLGDDVAESGPMSQVTQDRNITLRFPVSGSKGSGVVVTSGTLTDQLTWERNESYLEMDGQKFDLDEDAGLTLEIE